MTDKIKEKILRLRNMVPERGASEAEALAAMEKADKLMSEHDISEADLRAAEVGKDMREGMFRYRMKAQHPSSKFCMITIGVFCNVMPWYSPKRQSAKAFGFHQDVEMYEFLTKLVHDSMDREWKGFLATNPPKEGVSRHTEYWSFTMGMAHRINAKLRELIDARKKTMSTVQTGTDLVEVKMAVVQAGLNQMLPDLNLRSRKTSTKVTVGAYAQGRAAGDKINLNRPIAARSGGTKAITG